MLDSSNTKKDVILVKKFTIYIVVLPVVYNNDTAFKFSLSFAFQKSLHPSEFHIVLFHEGKFQSTIFNMGIFKGEERNIMTSKPSIKMDLYSEGQFISTKAEERKKKLLMITLKMT